MTFHSDALMNLSTKLAHENHRLREALSSLLDERGSIQYPAQHQKVLSARKALEVPVVPLESVTTEMRQAGWKTYPGCDIPYSAIFAVMSQLFPGDARASLFSWELRKVVLAHTAVVESGNAPARVMELAAAVSSSKTALEAYGLLHLSPTPGDRG